MKKMITLIALAALGNVAGAATVLFEDDLSSLPQNVELDRSSWWGPSWNGGDIAYSMASANGPDGKAEVTKTTEVFAGRFYGGGLRSALVPIPELGGAVDPAKVTVSFWIKGTSTQSRGAVGFSVIGFDSASGSNVESGAYYYKVPIAPAEWTQITLTLDQAQSGIPGHGSAGIPLDFSVVDIVQIFFWTRSEFETGWPIQENENHKWSFSIADISIVADVAAAPTWAGYPIADGWVDTGDFFGFLYVEHGDWVYSASLADWVFLPESQVGESGAWAYILK